MERRHRRRSPLPSVTCGSNAPAIHPCAGCGSTRAGRTTERSKARSRRNCSGWTPWSPIPTDDQKHPVSPADRGLIQLYYTPASRDAGAQIRATTGALAARLLRAIEWSSETQDAVNEASESLGNAFEGEDAIAAISKALATRWSDLHDEAVDTKPRVQSRSSKRPPKIRFSRRFRSHTTANGPNLCGGEDLGRRKENLRPALAAEAMTAGGK